MNKTMYDLFTHRGGELCAWDFLYFLIYYLLEGTTNHFKNETSMLGVYIHTKLSIS